MRFGVSGKPYRGALVMYDAATESLWSKLLATAIQGSWTGDRLSLLPTRLTSAQPGANPSERPEQRSPAR